MNKERKQGYQPICKVKLNSVIPPNTGSNVKMKNDKFYNPPIMFAVAESELQRFRELETENTLLKVQIEGLKKENERLKQENGQLKEQNEKMKCCQNCTNETVQPYKEPCYSCRNRSEWRFAE